MLEKLAGNAAHKSGGQKYRHQREGGGNHRQANFIGCFHRRLVRRFAHAQVAHDVFNLHNRVVDQNTNHQTERQQRHHVDGKAQVVHADESRNHRQRQRHGCDEGRPPVAQKQPHHQHCQQCAFSQQREGRLVLFLHRGDKVEGLDQLHIRVRYLKLRQRGTHAAPHIHLARTFGTGNLKADHGHTVEQR